MSNEVKITTTTDDTESLLHAAGQGAELTESSETQPQSEERRAEAERGELDAQQRRDGKPRSSYRGAQKRIDVLTRRNKDYEREIAELKNKYERPGAMEERVFAEINQRRQATQQPEPRETKEASQAARVDRTANGNAPAQSAATETQQQAPPVPPEFRAKVDAHFASVREEFGDLRTATQAGAATPINLDPEQGAAARAALFDSGNSGKLFRHMLENPELCEELETLSPNAIYSKLMKLSGRLEAPHSNGARSNDRTAPAPIRPVGGSSTKSSVPEEDLPYRQWADKRNAAGRERAKRGYSI